MVSFKKNRGTIHIILASQKFKKFNHIRSCSAAVVHAGARCGWVVYM